MFNITDSFLACAGHEVIEIVANLIAPTEPVSCEFKELEAVLKQYMEPEERLVISERNKFFTLSQGESSIAGFVVNLIVAAKYCKFIDHKESFDPNEEKISMRLISGLSSSEKKLKLLDHLQSKPAATVREITCFVQSLDQNKQFVDTERATENCKIITIVAASVIGNIKEIMVLQNVSEQVESSH